MIKGTPIFIFNSLDTVRGGLTKAVLTRANFFADYFEDVIILTLKFQPNFRKIINELYSSGMLDKRVKVLNFFDDIKEEKVLKKKIKWSPLFKVKERGYAVFKDKKQKLPSYRYYKNGLYVKYKRFDKNYNLLFIDYMNEGRHRYRRDEFDENGILVRTRHMDLVHNKPKLDRYFDSKGKCYLSVWLDMNGNQNRTVYLKNEYKEYNSLQAFCIEWLEKQISKTAYPILFSDSRSTDDLILNIKNKSAKKIAVLHNNHFAAPYDETGNIRKSWEPFFNNIDSFDVVIFLTVEQKEDIIKQFGEQTKYLVIPHFVKKINVESTHYNPKLVVSLTRYDPQKRLDEAIRAFKHVVKEIPEAEYHIYGFGPQEEDLKKLIHELNLDKNVKLMGFTTNPTKIYQSAACSILTSDYEGFGMAITESLAAGTPVIAYDIKYGPKEIIRHGVDGFLVPKGDTKKLADRIIEILKNKELREALSNNSRDVFVRFSEQKYQESWLTLLKNLF